MPAGTSTLCNAGLPGLSPALIAPGRFPSSKVHLLRPHKSSLHVTNKNIPRQTPRGENIKQIQIKHPAEEGSRGEEGKPAGRNPRTWPGRGGRGENGRKGRPGQVRNSQRPGSGPRKGRGELGLGRRGPGRAAGKEGRGRCPERRVGPEI